MIDGAQQGLNSQTVPAADAVTVVELAAAEGFTAVELAGELIWGRPVEPVAAALRDAGVSLLGLCPTPALHGWHTGPAAATTARLVAELDHAAALGARYFVMPFMRPGGDPDSVVAGLRAAVPYAAEHGLRLAVEAIGHVPLLNQARELITVLERVGSPEIGVLLDAFHFFRAGQTLDDLEAYREAELLAVQVSNANERPTQELLGYRDRTFPSDGRFPVPDLVEAVLGRHPGTPVVVEVIGEVARSHSPATGARLARQHLNRILGPAVERRSA